MKLLHSLKIGSSKIVNLVRSGRRTRVLFLLLIILIVLPLVINTLLNSTENQVKADSYFKFDEGYGTSNAVNDTNGVVSAGTISNATWQQDDLCRKGKCLHFDGTTDSVSFGDPSNAALDFYGTDDFTIEGWFRHPTISTNPDYLVAKHAASTAGGYKVYMDSDGDMVFAIDDDGTWGPEDSIGGSLSKNYDDNKWHHFAAVKDGASGIYLYIDGILVDQDESLTATGSLANAANFYVGIDADGSSNSWDGFIDEVSISHSAKTASQISADYMGASSSYMLSKISEGLVGHWKMDETSWTNDCSTDSALDSSGNGNNGDACPTSTGPTGGASGKFGNGGNFTKASSQYIKLGNVFPFTSSFTISAWINPTTLTLGDQPPIIVKTGTGSARDWALVVHDTGPAQVRVSSNGTDTISQVGTTTIQTGIWTHVVGIYNAQDRTLLVYTNGIRENGTSSGTVPASINSTSNEVRIASRQSNSTYWDGFIDEVRVYNRALSPTEVSFLYSTDFVSHGTAASFGPDQSYLSNGLVGYWKMDDSTVESEDEITLDYSGNGINGTLYGDDGLDGDNGSGMDHAAGKFGGAKDFDGTDDYILLSANDVFDFGTGSFTYSAWVNTIQNCTNKKVYIGTYGGTPNSWLGCDYSTGKAVFTSRDSNSVQDWVYGTTSINDGSWHLVIGVKKDDTLQIFVDGVLENSIEVAYTGNHTSNADYNIGRNNTGSGYYADATIDEARIYNRALSPGEVKDLYEWAPGPVGYWKMDETSSNANDSSGNNYTLTNNNSTPYVNGKFGNASKHSSSSSQYFNCTDANCPNLSPESKSFTTSAWVNLTDKSTHRGIVEKASASNSTSEYTLYYHSGVNRFRFELISGSTETTIDANSLGSPSTNTWYFVTAWYNAPAQTMGIMINGSLSNSQSYTSVVNTTTSDFKIGRQQLQSTYMNGMIDQVTYYNYVRTPAQIIEDMNAGHPAPGSPVGSALGHWKFDEGYGETLNDSGTGGNNGDMTGSCPGAGTCPTWSNSGKLGKALSFDGGDSVNVGSPANLDDIGPATYSFWYYPTGSANYGGILSKSTATGAHGLVIDRQDATNSIEFYRTGTTGNLGAITTDNSIELNSWNHVVITWDGTLDLSGVNIYIDGEKQNFSSSSSSGSGSPEPDASYDLVFGYNQISTNFYEGLIDEVKLYNFALTADQVKTEYAGGFASSWGASGTDSTGAASNAAANEYCPPGQTTACVGPVGEWKFDENTGQSANDTSGNDNTGTLGSTGGSDSADPVWLPGKFGYGLQFDGSDDHVSVTDPGTDSIFDYGSGDSLTLSAWVYMDELPYGKNSDNAYDIIVKGQTAGTDNANYEFYFQQNTSSVLYLKLGFEPVGGGWIDWATADIDNIIQARNWYHVATQITFGTSSSVKFFINGQYYPYSDPGASSAPVESNDPLWIGANNYSGGNPVDVPLNGLIDNVRIYNYIRTPAQIAWEYNHGAPVAYYKFDECTGATAYNSATNANGDAAGMNGTIVPGGVPNSAVGDCTSTSSHMRYSSTNGKRNAALEFDGTDDYVTVADANAFDFGTSTDFSTSLWVKISDKGSDQVFIHDGEETSGSGDGSWDIRYNDTNSAVDVVFTADTYAYYCLFRGTTDIEDNMWHHLTAIFKRNASCSTNDINLYIDGKKENLINIADHSSSYLNVDISNNDPITIGAYKNTTAGSGYSGYTNGQIDEVKIFGYALNAKQILNEYNSGAVNFGY